MVVYRNDTDKTVWIDPGEAAQRAAERLILPSMPDHPLPPSEAAFRQRVRDLEAAAHANALAVRRMVKLMEAQAAENARLHRALRVLAKMQPARVREAMMEVIRDA